VPPAIAKIIGYDRLEKINNRGKKETSKRIEENGQQPVGAAGGGFLARKKLANGGEIDTSNLRLLPEGELGKGAYELEAQEYFDQLQNSDPEKFAAIQQLDAELEESLLSIADRDPVFTAGLEGSQSISEFVAPISSPIPVSSGAVGVFRRAESDAAKTLNQPQGFIGMRGPNFRHPVLGDYAQSAAELEGVPYERVLIHEIMHKGADQIERRFKNRGALQQIIDVVTGKESIEGLYPVAATPAQRGRAEHKYINAVLNTVAIRRGAKPKELNMAIKRAFSTYMNSNEREKALVNNEQLSIKGQGKNARLQISATSTQDLKQILTDLNGIMMEDKLAQDLKRKSLDYSSATR